MAKPIIKTQTALREYVLEEYYKYDSELTALHFDVQVCMPERDILEAYRDIQKRINGDHVGRFNVGTNEDGVIRFGEEFIKFIPEGKYEELYEGNCKDFLESFNGKESDTGFCRICDDEVLDFIF